MSFTRLETALFLEVIYPVLNRLSQTNNPPETRKERELLIKDVTLEILRNMALFMRSERAQELTPTPYSLSQRELNQYVLIVEENVKMRVVRHFPIRTF